ncbi:MAG: hypothetical protein H0U71_00700 [Gammaproteobacteria bacterium]|nr:hypothetical protein [Gammaproteobacteria bacterium]
MRRVFFLILLLCYLTPAFGYPFIDINRESALRIGIKIWYNECNGKIAGLTTWNNGERFASLGIGHFNWFPKGHLNSAKDGFPQLIRYMERVGVTVPYWLQGEITPPCPWHTREEFQAAQQSKKMQELRQFLVDTIPVQAQFMVYRLVNALPKLITNTPYEDREFIFEQFVNLSSTPQGIYALVDYVNFKGEGAGVFSKRGSGWGLLQVVEGMRYAPCHLNTVQAFVWSANNALTERVRQASPSSHEGKWLPGWRNRICTYLH